MSDEILFEGKFISVVERDGWYQFMRPTRSGGIVYILVIREGVDRMVLGRYEVCPAHDDEHPTLTSITGAVPAGTNPDEIAILEAKEEAGYAITKGDLIKLGTVRLSKAADTTAYLYAVNVTDIERGNAPGDGSFGEIGSYCDWITMYQAIQCKCPVMPTMIARLLVKRDGDTK